MDIGTLFALYFAVVGNPKYEGDDEMSQTRELKFDEITLEQWEMADLFQRIRWTRAYVKVRYFGNSGVEQRRVESVNKDIRSFHSSEFGGGVFRL